MASGKNDIDVQEFAEMLCYLEPHPPVTNELDHWRNPYTSEKAHMVLWFGSQETKGSGSYTRNAPNSSARTTYNRLLAPGAMLWIAEALGETPERLRAAVKSAREAEKEHWRNRGAGFRAVIPFDRIYELCGHPEGWRYEKRLLPLLHRDEQGYPYPTDEKRYEDIVIKELK